MINEKMIELLVLSFCLQNITEDNIIALVGENGITYNMSAMRDRIEILLEEFLEPYVIKSDPKG